MTETQEVEAITPEDAQVEARKIEDDLESLIARIVCFEGDHRAVEATFRRIQNALSQEIGRMERNRKQWNIKL